MKKISFYIVLLLGFCSFFESNVVFSQDLKSAIKLTQSEQFDIADKAFRSLMQSDSKNGDVYYYFGENFLKSYFTDTAAVSFKEMLDSAHIYFSKGVKADAANPLNYVGLGSVALYRKDAAGAKTQFDNALRILPSKKYKDSPVTKPKAALALAKMAEAYIFIEPKDIQQAITLMNQALEFDNSNPQVYIIAGDIYLEDNDGSKAIANYKKAQELNVKSTIAKTKQGNIYVRVKNLNAAIPYFEEAVTLDPNFAPVYRELGELYYKAGKYDKAEANYKKYLDLSDNFAAKTKYIVMLYLIKKYDDAAKYINEVFKVDTSSVVLNRIAAYSAFETNKYADALKYSERFFRLAKPEKIFTNDYLYQGRILTKLEKDSIAIERYKSAIKVDSMNTDAMSDVANAYIKLKKNEDAIPWFENKIRLGKGSVLDIFNLGKVYYNLTDSLKNAQDTFRIQRADTLFGTFISRQQESMNGIIWKARVKFKYDMDLKKGIAKPYYEIVIKKAITDSVKYTRDLIEGLGYMASYNLFTTKDYVTAKRFFERILAIEPKNAKAIIALKSPELKNIKTK